MNGISVGVKMSCAPPEPNSLLDRTLLALAPLARSFCSRALTASPPLGFCSRSNSADSSETSLCQQFQILDEHLISGWLPRLADVLSLDFLILSLLPIVIVCMDI